MRLSFDECNKFLDGIGEIITPLIDDDDTHTRVQTMEFDEDDSANIVIGFDDIMYQTNSNLYVNKIKDEGECMDGGFGEIELLMH